MFVEGEKLRTRPQRAKNYSNLETAEICKCDHNDQQRAARASQIHAFVGVNIN